MQGGGPAWAKAGVQKGLGMLEKLEKAIVLEGKGGGWGRQGQAKEGFGRSVFP